MATSNDNLRRLYQNGLKHFSLPDFDTFERDMKDEVKRQRFYTNMQAAYSLPDFDTFSKDIGVVATDSPTPVKPATQTPAQSQERVTSTTVKPLTDTTPQLLSVQQDVQPIAQPAKPEGWEPSPMQHRAFQMQMDEANARLKKQGEDFQQRMEGIEKGNRPGSFMGEREFNPQTGQMETHYYTQQGERVGSRMEQSRRNSEYNQWWENNTEAGRRSKEQRLQREFDDRLFHLWNRHNPKEGENAAEQAWSAAEKRQGIDRNRIAEDIYHDRGDAMSNAAFLGGRENHIMNAAENSHRSMVAHFTNFDLDRLMNESWDNLGEDGQKALIDDCYQMLRYRNPGADELVLYNQAKQFARQQSDLRLYNLAVEKNLPKGNLEYLMRKIGDMNLLMNVSKGLAVSSADGKTGDMAAYEAANEQYRQDGHKILDVTGMVAGFALDPTTWLSAGVGSAATRSAMWAGGRWLAGRGASAAVTQAATRQFATSMTGRIVGGIAGGATNFGTFEGVKEMENQFAHGGHIIGQDETGRYINEGYSAGAVAGQFGHGLMMGAAVGWLGPVSGNVSDKLVRATSSTVGKVTTRAGVYTGATLAEGTIFSVPEWIEGERDAMDVWNDNMAMMVGFKAKHMLKSAGGVLGDLKASFDSPTNGQKNRLDFESRLRQRMDAPSDGGMALTEDEKAELKRYGYDLHDLVESSERTGDPAEGSLIAQNAPEIVSRLTDMVTNPRISEAARAKMYYYATGRRLPMSTVMRGELIEDGDGGFIVESQGANGVITSRSFKSRKAADLELERIKRQTELNSIEIGERYQQTADFENRLQEACRTVAAENGWNMVEVYRTCEEARRNHLRGGDKQFDEVQQNILRKVTEAMGEFEETGATDAIRGRINEKYGVDIDGAIRKEANRRTQQEQTAIDEYIAELIPDKAKEPNSVEDAQAEDITNQKLLSDEPGEPQGPAEGEPIDPRFDSSTDPTPDYDPHQPGGEQAPIGRAVMKYQDRPVEVLSGRVVMMEDGTMIDNERSDTSIVIRDLATGKVEMVSPEAILTYEEYAPNATEEAEPTPTEADDPAGDVQPQSQYTSGQIKIRNSDGTETRGVLTGYVDENGNHEYYVEGDLQHLHYASDHELDNILSEYVPDEVEGEATAGKPTAPGTKTDEKDESDVSDVTDVADEVHGAVSAVAPTETPEEAPAGLTALERLPKNEKGEPIFEQAENPEHGWDALVEFAEGDASTAKEIADTMAEEKRKAYEKAQKQKPKGKTPTEILSSKKAISAELAQAEQEYNLWQQMANVEQRRQDVIRSQQEAESRQRAAERAETEKAERAAREEAARQEREALDGIPEWHLDTPENARKRGVRRFSGQMFPRQEPVQGVVGKEVEVKFSQKDLPKGHLAVIEAPQLQPSHIQGQRNPMFFIEEAQPKNRAEAVSMFAAKEMAEGIRPQEITGSATAYTGAPTVNTRGEVIQGNNRSDALRYLWENKLPEQQQTYKQYLIDNAEQFGLDPEAVNAMQQPVLVNMLDVDDAEAIRLGQMTAQDTESGGVERIKPKNVAQKLGEDMRIFASQLLRSGDEEASFGQLVDRNGTEVLKWMAQKGAITNTQYQSAFDSKGNLTAEAKNDLQKVLYQAVFKGGSQQLEEMFDALPAKAQRAILSTAFRDMDSPFAGKMLPEIQASIAAYHQLMRDPAFAASKKLEDLLRAVETFKQVIELDDRFEQYAPADNFSNFALHLAAMYKAGDMSQTTLAGYFNQMYDLAQGKKAATLFEEADTTEYPLAEVVNKVLGIDYQPAKNGNNNVANGGADVALRNQDGQGGELRGNEPPASREHNSEGAESAERGRGIAGDGRGSGNLGNGGKGETEAPQTKLSKEAATDIIAKMETSAVNDPQISLSPESWQNSFGLGNSIDTPLGKVKMGEGQYQKLVDKKRSAEFGMVVQTLQDPDIVFIEPSEAKEGQTAERDFSYVFVKTFIRDGQKFKYYTSVSVLKDGMEVSVSSHIASKTAIMKKLQGMERAYTKQSLLPNSSEWHLAEHPTDVPDLLPTQGKSDADLETSAKTEPQQPNNAVSSDSSLSTDEQSGTSSIEPNGESTASDRKVNNYASEKQESREESSAQRSDREGTQTVQAEVEAASAQVNTEPTPAQAEAGNYKKGHVTIGEFDITIENPAGSLRKGVGADGKEWSNTMANTYGYIKGTEGVDGDHIDVFLHSDMDQWNGRKVFVVDQTNTDGSFDEHKVMLGFNDKDEAMTAYLANYDKTWADTHPGLRISETNIEDFNKWVQSSHRKTKPFADYTTVRKEATAVTAERGAAEAAKQEQKSSRLEIEGDEKLSAERREAVERYGEGHYCVPIRVIADEADIRESGLSDVAVAQMMAALTEEDVPAVYCREDKKIYIFAGHKDSNVGSTLAHENFHALADAIGDARERNRMFEAYRKTLLADPKCGVYFKELWDAVINAYALEEALEDFVGYTINRMYSAPGFIGHLERVLDGDVKEYIFNKFINRIFNGTAQESSKPANQQGNSENDGRMAGLLRRGDSAGSAQTEGRAAREETGLHPQLDSRNRREQRGRVSGRGRTAGDSGREADGGADAGLTAAEAAERTQISGEPKGESNNFITPILYGTHTKTDAHRPTNPENRRGGGAGVQQGRAGNSQAEGRADGEESAGEEIADGKAGGAAEVAKQEQKDNEAELNSQPDGGGDVRMSIGGSGEANAAVYQATKEMLESAGVKVHEIGNQEALAMLEKKNTPVAGLPNRANEKQPSGSVLAAHSGGSSSNATDSRKSEVKIDNNTRSAKNKIKKFKNGDFDGDYSTLYKALSSMGNLLSMRNRGGSRYTILRTDKGDAVAIRLSDHRANGNNFGRDVADRNLSIVIERKRYDVPDSEIEFTEAVIPLRVFEMHPKEVVSAIVNGVDDVLADKPFTLDGSLGAVIGHHGNDVRFHIRTYHGTGAEFDRFDFGYVGSGEGAQAFGWGGYVTEVKGIGKSYASAIGGKELLPKIEKVAGNIRQVRQWLSKNEEYNKYARNAGRHLRELQREYRAAEKEGNEKDRKFYGGLIELQEQSMKPENHASLIANKRRQIDDYQKELKDLEAQLAQKRHLYTVRIPDDTGDNYLDWDGGVTDSVRDKIVLQADAEGVSISFYGDEMAAGGYFAKMGENAAGFQLYGALARSLGSDKAASGLLSRAGLTGIKYAADRNNGGRADGKKNYVVFKEDDMRITGHVRFLKGGDGTVYGWVAGGEVYLNRDVMNPETPVHEYTHLWDEMVRRENPELWARGVELMKQTPLWDEVLSDPNYADIRLDEDAIASEVHARLTGSDGAKLMEEMIVRAKKEGVFEIARAVSLVEELKRWLSDMFKSLKKTLDKWSKRDLRNLTVESFNRMTLRDLAEGKNPRSAIISRETAERGLRLHAAMARGREAFDALRDRAVAERGIVMPGLNEKVVRVVEVPRHDFAGNGKEALQAAEKWAKENIVGTHTALDSRGDEFGYTISGDAVEKYVSRSATGKSANIGVHLAALKKLPEIIKESIEAEVHPDYDKLNGIRNAENITNPETLIHRFYGAANVDGTIYRVKTTMREYRDKNRSPLAHSYEITQIELLEAPSDGVINNSGEPLAMTSNSSNVEPTVSPKDSGVPHRIANLLKGVEKSYDAGKKLLEESEKSELFRQGSGSMVSREGDIHFRGHERINAHQQEMAQTSPEAKSSHAEKLAKKFNTPIQVVTDTKELTSDNAERQARMRRSKGFYDPATGKVVVVLPNNANVEDVAETVFHEVVAHKGLREMLGDENYDAFCDEVYDHLKDDLKEEVDRETTRRFEREPEKGYEHHRRVAVDELFGRMAEKGFEDFTKAERGIWAKLKAKVLEAINKFLGSLKLPKWVRLGDNELRYMLWRSHEKLRSRGSTPNEPSGMDYVDMARDAVKREELGLNKTDVIVTRSKKTTADKIEELFNAAVSGNLKGKPVEIGILTEAGRDYLEKMSGITMKERVAFVLNPSDLVHMYRDHFGNNEKDRGNNVPLTIEDIRAMSDVVSNPERIIFGIEPDGLKRKLFYFLAPAKEGSYNLLEIYGDRKGNLTAKTFYKTRKGVSQRALSLMKSEHLTSVTDGATLSDGAKIPKIIDTLTIEDEEKFDFRFRDQNGETGDIWKDQSVGLQERITNAAIRLSNNQSGDLTLRNDAMRAIGGNLNDLRKAMSAQKRYDQTTVKRVADLARILMQNGYLSGMTSGEMQRLLSAVKNSTAMHDISESVQKIMDIMVNNQLRNAEGALRQLLSIRGSKVDARGVEVQGVLDVEGQRTMEVVKKAMSLTEYDINDRIAEALNRMSDPDQTIADQAALEYAGLNMALDYVQNIANSKAEEKTLRDSLKTAKEDRDAGRMTDDAYKQFVEATEDAIRKNKVERAEAYFNLVGRLSDSLRESIENAKAFREAEKARVSEIHHNANSDMEGRPTNEHGMKKKGLGVKLSNSMVSRLLLAPAATFEQIMRVFGSKSVDGEGYLFDRYVRGWQECRDKEWTSIQEVEGILDKKAAEILGKRRARWSDLYALTTKAAGSCDWWDGGEIREHKVTQGNLMYMYMVNKMTDGQVKLRRMCITDDKMLEIEHALDPKLKALADWLQEELLPNLRNKYNETHKRMFGASMAAIENYFPLRILANARLEEVEMAGKIDGKDLPKTMTGAIIKRRYNNYALDVLNSDAVSVALDHIREMETWAAFAEYRRDLCTLLSYKHFRNQVKNMSTIYGSGEKFWDKFYDLALLVGGAYQPKTSDFDKVAVNITKLATGACIAIRLNTALKQLLSYPAFAPDANQARLVYNMTPWRARACWKWAMKNMPSFERRWKSRQAGNDLLRAWEFDWDWTRTDFVQRVQRAGITPNAFIDALTVAMGSEAVYHSKLNGYLKDGFSKEEAHHRAIQDAEIIFNLSQQSSEWPYLSLLQNDRSYLTTCITNFRNSPMSYLRQSIQSKRELANMVKGKDVQIEFETKKGIREGLTPEQAKARAERKYKRNWVRNLFKSTTFDYILPALWAFGLSGIWYCIFGDDEKKKAQYAEDALKRGLLGGFEGMTVGGTMPDFIYGLATDDKPQLDEETSPAMGLITDMANLYSNGKTERAANEMINTMVALGVGVNPQVLEDGVVAGMDFFGEDEKNARDWALLFMRVLSCPQSQMDQVYFDELGMDAREASRKSPAELAERYATYKARRANFATMWSYDDERWETEIKGSWRKKFEKEARARLESQSEAHVADSLEAYDAEWSQTGKRLKALRDQSGSIADKAAQAQAIFESPEGIRYKLYKNLHPYLDKMVKRWLNAPTAQDAATEATAIIEYKAKLVEMLDAWDNPEKSRAAGREAMSIVREWHNRQNPKK